jgi:hypothetical protein
MMRVVFQTASFLAALTSLNAFFVPLRPVQSRISVGRTSNLASSLDVDISNLSDATDGATNGTEDDSLPKHMLHLPRHPHEGVNEILVETEHLIQSMHTHTKKVDRKAVKESSTMKTSGAHDAIFANTYVDLGKVDTVGFDYDYTLVTYTEELLNLIYEMALQRLVIDRQYPLEMLEAGLKFDPFFSIRGKKLSMLYLITL